MSSVAGGYYADNYGQWLPASRNAAILDIGCGQGDFIRYLHAAGYRNLTAIDIDPAATADLAALDGVHTMTAAADAPLIHALDGSYDLIIAKQMIYYLDRTHIAAFVQALRDKLAPDGVLAIEIFNGGMISSRLTEMKDPYILTAYDEHALRRLLEWNGLQVEVLRGQIDPPGSWRRPLYRLLQRANFALWRARLTIERGAGGELPTIWQRAIVAIARRR